MASEDTVVAQSLECCLCFEYFSEPKNLSCGHNFCKQCLELLYYSRPQQDQISCPICRQITKVNNGDVSKLPTNIVIKSMVEDIKSGKRSCTACDPEAKSPAVQYCAQCNEYMCDSCAEAHGKFKVSKKHAVVSMDEVQTGKVKVKRFCTKHPEEEKLYVCTSCKASICFRCRMLDHSKPDHKIKELSDYKKTALKQIKSLQTNASTKIRTLKEHIELANEQRAVVEDELDQRIAEINQSYEESVKDLMSQRNNLIDRCKRKMASHIAQLETIKESYVKGMFCIQSASELVGNGIKASLEGPTLAAHDRICRNLEKMLGERAPDATQLKSIADGAKHLEFIKGGIPNRLGKLRLPDSQLEKVSTFPLSHASPCDAVPLPDGRVAVGYGLGKAIEMFTADGPQGTVLRDVAVWGASVLSDGRYVILGDDDNITLYTQSWEKLHVQFDLKRNRGCAEICTDRDDNIYCSTVRPKEIAVFKPKGGAPVQKISCQDYKPHKIYHMNHSNRLVVCDRSNTIRVIGDKGGESIVFHRIKIDRGNVHIALLKDDTIVLGCKLGDLLSIEHYTQDLKRISTVLKDFPMANDLQKLVELPTGEIVVVSEEQFIVFRKI